MLIEAHAVVHTAARRVELQPIGVPQLADDQVLIKSHHSAISPGTEAMIFEGRFPHGMAQDAAIPSLSSHFSYPFRYGYAVVGEVVAVGSRVDENWMSRYVFTFHPHQTYAAVALSDCIPLPETVLPLDALFLPNMESAVNFVMDAAPLLGEKVLVFGQGVVGLLTAALLARCPLSWLVTVDPIALRRNNSTQIGATRTIDPGDAHAWQTLHDDLHAQSLDGFDLVFELSGNINALNKAIDQTGFSGRIVVGSWYGSDPVSLDLGGHFHRRRIQLLSSQVSTINPSLSGRWDKKRRIDTAWHWLGALKPEQFITHRFKPEQCQQAFETNSEHKDSALQIIFDY